MVNVSQGMAHQNQEKNMEVLMPRKRNKDQSSTEGDTSDKPSTTILTEGATIEPAAPQAADQAVDNPAPAENSEPKRSFVDRIEQERRAKGPTAPDPFGIAADYAAGVRLFESKQDRVMAIKFDEKPSPEVLERLKLSGYRWNPRDKVWVRPVHPESARTTRIDAERLYQVVREMVREEKGIESGQEIPF
jgi:hypothetical protein